MKKFFTKIYILSVFLLLIFSVIKAQASTIYFSDNFENGLNQWLYSGQDWDTTSATQRDGKFCIASNPNGDYPQNANEIIQTANQIDLTTAIQPMLTFWQRYGINNNSSWNIPDTILVEISKNNGLTWTELTKNNGYLSTWNYTQVDLKSYVGLKIKIRFRLWSANNQDQGWYIDDIAIQEMTTNSVQMPFTDNFENGLSQWLYSSKDWDTTSATQKAGKYCIASNPNGNYPNNANEIIQTANQIDLTTANHPLLTFWQRYGINNNSSWNIPDTILVEISKDNGLTWTELTKNNGYLSTWNYTQVDLKSYVGLKIKIRFRLWSANNQDQGWYIDDIAIQEMTTNSVQMPFTDNFENGLSQWLYSSKDWDTTSSTKRSGKYCIASNPNGNYPNNANEIIQTANQIDLTTAIQPMLTFWQKYGINNNSSWNIPDTILVEISKDDGFTWTELTKNNGYLSTWNYTQIDLTSYVGSKIKIKFRLWSANNQDQGWYIDDVDISDAGVNYPPPIPSLLNPGNNSAIFSVSPSLTWSASSGATSYSLQLSPDSTFATTFFNQSNLQADSETVSGLSVGTIYYWRVNASNSAGTSSWSSIWDFSVVQDTLKRGDVDESGGPDAYSAALVLEYLVGLDTLNAVQLVAADADKDGLVTANDAEWILYATNYGNFSDGSLPKAADVQIGSVAVGQLSSQENSNLITIPVILEKSQGIHACYLALNIDNTYADVDNVAGSLPKGWLMVHNYINGVLKIAMAGVNTLQDGTIAAISLKLRDKTAKFDVTGSAKLNTNLNQSISSFIVQSVPSKFGLSQNYPNPFNPSTTINYQLAQDSHVSLMVYDILGQKVKTLVNGLQQAGYYNITWDGNNDFGGKAASGIYIYRLQSGNFIKTLKMNLLK